MNATYRKNLKSIATACKNYTDEKISDLEWRLGANNLSVDTDTSTGYTSSVPSGTIAAKFTKIGGMSYKYNQLFNYSTITINSSMITNNNDGSFTINYNNTNTGYAELGNFELNVVANRRYLLLGFFIENKTYLAITGTGYTENSSNLIYTPTSSGTATIYWRQYGETNIENVKVIPQIFDLTTLFGSGNEPADVATAITQLASIGIDINIYNEYSTGKLRHAKVESVDIESRNLLNISDMAETAQNGITYSVSNGVISLNGTAGATFGSNVLAEITLPAGTYYLTQFVEGTFTGTSSTNIALRNANWSYIGSSVITGNNFNTNGKYTTFTLSEEQIVMLMYYFASGDKFTNYKHRIVISKEIPTTYTPYVATINKPIPASVQALDGYGMSASSSVYNYIEYDSDNKTWAYNQPSGIVDLSTLTFNYNSSQKCWSVLFTDMKPNTGDNVIPNIISDLYPSKTIEDIVGTDVIGISSNTLGGLFVNNGSSTAAPSGYIVYELATPVTTDITTDMANWDNPIEFTDDYGTVQYTNEDELDLPYSITYLKEVAK